MNMPNFAACHHAILCARVAACMLSVVENALLPVGDWFAVMSNAPAPVEHASAPAAPRFFKNERLEIASMSILFFSPSSFYCFESASQLQFTRSGSRESAYSDKYQYKKK
jgi:hypothetical protein